MDVGVYCHCHDLPLVFRNSLLHLYRRAARCSALRGAVNRLLHHPGRAYDPRVSSSGDFSVIRRSYRRSFWHKAKNLPLLCEMPPFVERHDAYCLGKWRCFVCQKTTATTGAQKAVVSRSRSLRLRRKYGIRANSLRRVWRKLCRRRLPVPPVSGKARC